jgi:tripartite-type tricarboxylate transporter receptor subunit TctC
MHTRRSLLSAAGALALPLISHLPASAQSTPAFPNRPLRLVAPFPPGGPGDALARILAQGMGDHLGQSVVVDNRPGGNSIIGTDLVARAAPDGHTLLLAIDGILTQNPFLYTKLPYDPSKDFEPIGLVADIVTMLAVQPSMQVSSVREFVQYAKQHPELQFGFGGVSMQIAGELFNQLTGAKLVGVPYKGGGLTVLGLMGGEVPVIFDGAITVLGQAPTGRVKPLAVLGRRRLSTAPEYPTMAEAGLPGFEIPVWQSLLAPAGTPRAVTERLNAAMRAAMTAPGVFDRLEKLGIQPNPTSAEEMVRITASDSRKWGPMIRKLGLKID